MSDITFTRTESEWIALDSNQKRVDLPKCEKRSIESISTDEFRHEYLERNRPIIITDALESWSSSEWDRAFFKENFGKLRQHVKLGQNGVFEGPGDRSEWADSQENQLPSFVRDKLEFPELVMERPGGIELSIGEIVDMFQNSTRAAKDEWISAYIEYTPMSNHFDQLKKNLSPPTFFDDLKLKHQNIWIGDGQTLGKLHFDEYENALAVVKGVKEVILFDPRNNENLYEGHLPEARFKATKSGDTFKLERTGLLESTSMVMSPVNILRPSLTKFPKFKEAKPMVCRVEAGEFLFLPSFWWHEVQSYPDQDEFINIAVNFWYQPFFDKEFPCQECPLVINPAYRDLL